MGKERAEAMMGLLPPVGWADVATKRDLDVLAAQLGTQIGHLDIKIDAVAERLDTRIDAMATKADMHELRSDLQRTFVTWMFASQAAVIAAVGLLLALVR